MPRSRSTRGLGRKLKGISSNVPFGARARKKSRGAGYSSLTMVTVAVVWALTL